MNDENDDEKSVNIVVDNIKFEENPKNFSIKYLAGFVFIKTNLIYSLIYVKGLWFYLLSILTNAKVFFILFINFCSRIQKIKFKTDYKDSITSKNWMFSIFLVSFGLYIIVYFFIYLGIFIKRKCFENNNENNNENINENNNENINENNNENINENNKSNITIETAILIFLILVFVFVFVVSLIFYINKSCEKIKVYISIAITGSVNYILYDFYSCQEVEYISLSGAVSIAQLAFRLIETIFYRFEANWIYLCQMASSFLGAILTFIYLFKFVEEEINLCFCI